MPLFALYARGALPTWEATNSYNAKGGTGVADAERAPHLCRRSPSARLESLPRVDGVVVKQAGRCIDDDESSVEVDLAHDLRHVGNQRFAGAAANHQANLTLTRIDAGCICDVQCI